MQEIGRFSIDLHGSIINQSRCHWGTGVSWWWKHGISWFKLVAAGPSSNAYQKPDRFVFGFVHWVAVVGLKTFCFGWFYLPFHFNHLQNKLKGFGCLQTKLSLWWTFLSPNFGVLNLASPVENFQPVNNFKSIIPVMLVIKFSTAKLSALKVE
jgi:hypothetical protein